MFKKIILVSLISAVGILGAGGTISGTITVWGVNPITPVSIRVVFLGSSFYGDPSDSLITSNLSFSKTFTKPWAGKVFIHAISQGFSMDTAIFRDSVDLNSNIFHVINNFTIKDTGKPVISKITVSANAKTGDSMTLSYRVVDNMWRVCTKRVEIHYKNNNSWGTWTTVDSVIEPCVMGGATLLNANPADSTGTLLAKQSGKAKKYVLTGYGTAQFRITSADSSGNAGVGLSDTFQVTLKNPPTFNYIKSIYTLTSKTISPSDSLFPVNVAGPLDSFVAVPAFTARDGITLNAKTGAITGTVADSINKTWIIRGYNSAGFSSDTVTIIKKPVIISSISNLVKITKVNHNQTVSVFNMRGQIIARGMKMTGAATGSYVLVVDSRMAKFSHIR